jgi:hypothetical protein
MCYSVGLVSKPLESRKIGLLDWVIGLSNRGKEQELQ